MDSTQSNIQELILKPTQLEHLQDVIKVLGTSFAYIDTSPTGSGKTFIAMGIAKSCGVRMLVVCPASLVDMWEKEMKTYGIQSAGVISYEFLRGTKRYGCTSGILSRYDSPDGKTTSYTHTELWDKMVQEGILLVIDEGHKVKNESDQNAAVACLARHIALTGNKSRFVLLSASFIDKRQQIYNTLRAIGLVTEPKPYYYDRSEKMMVLTGFREIIKLGYYYSKTETDAILPPLEDVTKDNIYELIYNIFIRVIAPRIVRRMEHPLMEGRKIVRNVYYEMENPLPLIAALEQLESASGIVREGKIESMGAVTLALQAVEFAKVPIFVRAAEQLLLANKNNRVIIYLNYNNTIEEVRAQLADFSLNTLKETFPIYVLNGDVRAEKRSKLVDEFQTNMKGRILISNVAVGGNGISLHDVTGECPRHMLISSDYRVNDLYQATGRIYRVGSKGDAYVNIVYGLTGKGKDVSGLRREDKILRALSEKAAVLKEAVTSGTNELKVRIQTEHGIVIEDVLVPGEVPEVFEDGTPLPKREELPTIGRRNRRV